MKVLASAPAMAVPAFRRGVVLITALALVLAGAIIVAISAGALAIPPARVVAILLGNPAGLDIPPTEAIVVGAIRLPRVLLVALAGGALGLSGVLMQGLFRNPLADPGLIGVSPGAGLAAGIAIVFGDRWFGAREVPFALLPVSAFVGALATTALITRIATKAGQTSLALLLLAGIAISAIAASGTGFLVFMADDKQLRDMNFWMLGSFSAVTWGKFMVAGPLLALTILVAPVLARALDALALGEADAWHMGVAVQRVKAAAIVLAALAVGTSVAVAGAVSFIGIIVPHVARLVAGPRHRLLMPAAALMGSTLLVAADTLARTLTAPAELPLGVLTALIGAPVFLHLLLGHKQRILS